MSAPKRKLAAPSTRLALAEDERIVVRGRVTAVLPDGRAQLETLGHASIECDCPQHVQVDWLRAAVAIEPVVAEASVNRDGSEGALWSLFPGPEHRDVLPERLELAASRTVSVSCGRSTLVLMQDGKMRLRARDMHVRGSRITRVQGGTVKLN